MKTAGSLCIGNSAMAASLPDGSRVRRESHARFCERLEVKSLRPTHPKIPILAKGKTDTGTYVRHLAGKVRQRRCFMPRTIGAANIRRGIFRTSPASFKLTPIAGSMLSSIRGARRRRPRLPFAGLTVEGRSSNWPISSRTGAVDGRRRRSRHLRWKRSIGLISCSRSSARSKG